MTYKEYQKKYRLEHKEERRQYDKLRRINNREELIEKSKIYRNKNRNKIKKSKHLEYLKHKEIYLSRAKKRVKLHQEEIKKYLKNYYQKNKQKILRQNIIRAKERRYTDFNYRLTNYLRTRIWWALKNNSKFASTLKLIGCSIDKLKRHLESKFTLGMSWNNYGKWHIDHIKPCASFDLRKKSEQKKCFNYKNLQPLWAKENLSKGSKIF